MTSWFLQEREPDQRERSEILLACAVDWGVTDVSKNIAFICSCSFSLLLCEMCTLFECSLKLSFEPACSEPSQWKYSISQCLHDIGQRAIAHFREKLENNNYTRIQLANKQQKKHWLKYQLNRSAAVQSVHLTQSQMRTKVSLKVICIFLKLASLLSPLALLKLVVWFACLWCTWWTYYKCNHMLHLCFELLLSGYCSVIV